MIDSQREKNAAFSDWITIVRDNAHTDYTPNQPVSLRRIEISEDPTEEDVEWPNPAVPALDETVSGVVAKEKIFDEYTMSAADAAFFEKCRTRQVPPVSPINLPKKQR